MSIFDYNEDLDKVTQQFGDSMVNGLRLEYEGPIVWRLYFRAPIKTLSKSEELIISFAKRIEIKKDSIGNWNVFYNGEIFKDNEQLGLFDREDRLFFPLLKLKHLSLKRTPLINGERINYKNDITKEIRFSDSTIKHISYHTKNGWRTFHPSMPSNKNYVYFDFTLNASLKLDIAQINDYSDEKQYFVLREYEDGYTIDYPQFDFTIRKEPQLCAIENIVSINSVEGVAYHSTSYKSDKRS